MISFLAHQCILEDEYSSRVAFWVPNQVLVSGRFSVIFLLIYSICRFLAFLVSHLDICITDFICLFQLICLTNLKFHSRSHFSAITADNYAQVIRSSAVVHLLVNFLSVTLSGVVLKLEY